MNNLQIYFLNVQETLAMVFNIKNIFIALLIINFFNFAHSEILYDKEGIIISNIDIHIYKEFYKNLYKNEISTEKSIKDVILIKKLIQRLKNKNPSLLERIDQQININTKNKTTYEENLRDYDRFLIIKNDMINEYYLNNFSLDEMEIILSKINNLKISLSINSCLTIEKIVNAEEISELPSLIFKKIKGNNDIVLININNKNYQICLNDNLYSILQWEISEYINIQIEKNLKEILYE